MSISVLANFNIPEEYKKDALRRLVEERPSVALIKAINNLKIPEFDDGIFDLLVRSIKSGSLEVKLMAMREISSFIPERGSDDLESIFLKLSGDR